MAKIYLVRHGEPSANWHNSRDPGLTQKGRDQAEAVANELLEYGQLRLFSSPMRRTRETAEPYARNQGLVINPEPAVAEIPSPITDLADRTPWLSAVMESSYPELGAELNQWRDSVLRRLFEVSEDSVFFTHYIAINVAVGAAIGDDRVVHFRPDHASLTVMELESGQLKLLHKGRQAGTLVL